jgi:hypothetical protein
LRPLRNRRSNFGQWDWFRQRGARRRRFDRRPPTKINYLPTFSRKIRIGRILSRDIWVLLNQVPGGNIGLATGPGRA